MYCVSMNYVYVCMCLVVPNMYSWRCTVAASSTIGTLSLYVTHKKFRKAKQINLILSYLILHTVAFDMSLVVVWLGEMMFVTK